MSFELSESRESDMAESMEVFAAAFEKITHWPHQFPSADTEQGQKVGTQRLVEEMRDPHARFLKVMDTMTGKIAGCALWLVFEGEERLGDEFLELEGDFWATQDDKERAQFAIRRLNQFRRNAINNANGNMLVMDMLAVAPAYQRQGVGRMLVNWGTKSADKLGFTAVVEASAEGLRVYESAGFEIHYYVAIQWPKKWKDWPVVDLYWLTRPAHQISTG